MRQSFDPILAKISLATTSRKYTCQLFLSQRREIFNRRVPGFPKTTQTYPTFSEDFRRRPKMSEDVPNNSVTENNLVHLSDPVLGLCFAKHDLVPNAFLVRNHRNRRFRVSTVQYHFFNYMEFSFTSFRKVFQFKLL